MEPLISVQKHSTIWILVLAIDENTEDIPDALPVDDSNANLEAPIFAGPIEFDESEWDHGEAQPEGFRDCFWGIIFLLQLVGVLVLSVMGIQNMIKD